MPFGEGLGLGVIMVDLVRVDFGLVGSGVGKCWQTTSLSTKLLRFSHPVGEDYKSQDASLTLPSSNPSHLTFLSLSPCH